MTVPHLVLNRCMGMVGNKHVNRVLKTVLAAFIVYLRLYVVSMSGRWRLLSGLLARWGSLPPLLFASSKKSVHYNI